MFKFLLLLFVLGFGAYKVISYFLRIARFIAPFQEAAKNFRAGGPTPDQKVRKEGSMDIEYVSEEEKERRQQSRDFRGGDYVDYEEVE